MGGSDNSDANYEENSWTTVVSKKKKKRKSVVNVCNEEQGMELRNDASKKKDSCKADNLTEGKYSSNADNIITNSSKNTKKNTCNSCTEVGSSDAERMLMLKKVLNRYVGQFNVNND